MIEEFVGSRTAEQSKSFSREKSCGVKIISGLPQRSVIGTVAFHKIYDLVVGNTSQ